MHITLNAPRVAPNDDDLAFEAWWESLGLDGEDVRAREYDRHVLAKMAFIRGVNHEVSRTRANAPKSEAGVVAAMLEKVREIQAKWADMAERLIGQHDFHAYSNAAEEILTELERIAMTSETKT